MDIEKELQEIKELALNNSKEIKTNTEKIENNIDKIQENAYGIEILRDYKRTNKRLYIVVILLIVAIIILGLHHLI